VLVRSLSFDFIASVKSARNRDLSSAMTETLRAAPWSEAEARKHRGTLRNATVLDSMGAMTRDDGSDR
jgi:hypothetical protein